MILDNKFHLLKLKSQLNNELIKYPTITMVRNIKQPTTRLLFIIDSSLFINIKRQNHSILICCWVTAKYTYRKTSTNSPRLSSVNHYLLVLLRLNVWRYSSAKNKSEKLNILFQSTNRNANL